MLSSLEYRIMGALLLGTSTVSELALLLSQPRHSVDYRAKQLEKHRIVKAFVSGEKPRWGGKCASRFELTPEGREWAQEMIGWKS